MITVIHINTLDDSDNSIRIKGASSGSSTVSTCSNVSTCSTVSESEDEGFSENSISSLTIKGPTGSVRGFKHCVRQTITSYYQFLNKDSMKVRDYEKEESKVCVLYTTSMGIIRNTFENCRKIRAILFQHLIRFEERDIYVNNEFKQELEQRCRQIILPCLFVNGKYFGDVESIERLNECGKLKQLLIDFKVSSALSSSLFKTCACCGNARFIPCSICHGSKKTFIHHFTTDSITLRCSRCNATGIIKCLLCYQ